VTSFGLTTGSQTIVGAPMDFAADVTNLGPDVSRGGTLQFTAIGDVVLGDLVGSCVEVPSASAVIVDCDVLPLSVGETDGNGRFQVIPQSEELVSVQARVSSALGDRDFGFLNNTAGQLVDVGPGG